MVELEQQYANMRVEQQLKECGLNVDSIQSIKDTTVITRDGAQHVVPTSQRFLEEATTEEQVKMSEEESAGVIASLSRQLQEQQRMFSRFKQFHDERTNKLEHQLNVTVEQLKDIQNQLMTLKSNQQAQTRVVENTTPVQNTEQQHAQQSASAAAPAQTVESKPIDRNNTAPVDVKVEKIFYCGES